MPEKKIIPLYRIYDINNKKYVSLDEYFVDGNGKVYQLVNSRTDIFIRVGLNQDNYIVERCSQKPDINKEWMYEGDICKGLWNTVFVIYYDKDYLQFRADLGGGLHREIDYLGFKRIEVIGNINKNPELLD